MSEQVWRMSAVEIAAAIRNRTISSREALEAHLDRIEAVNGQVNAVTLVLADEARAAADAADAALARGDDVGPLHGLPITVKENVGVAGTATTHGLVSYADKFADEDAPVVGFLRDAGAIVMARTNMPDYGLRWHTDNDLHGATLNPWNPERTPGGSSGGEAAALATGMTPLGIGNDMGGSTRQPAICCGVAGLRPSLGRVSRTLYAGGDDMPMFYEQMACVNGPMARRVGDLRLALSVMQRCDPGDPVWCPSTPPPKPAQLRVGIVRDPSGEGVDAGVAEAVERAARALADAGYAVEDIEPLLLAESDETIQRLGVAEIASYLDEVMPLMSEDAGRFLRHVIGDNVYTLGDYREAIAERHRIQAAWSRMMADTPLVIGPVSARSAFPVGYDVESPDTAWKLIRSLCLTEVCNLTGMPSVAVPVCVVDGIPEGVQVIGRRFDDDRCLDAAEVIERAGEMPTPIDPRS